MKADRVVFAGLAQLVDEFQQPLVYGHMDRLHGCVEVYG